MQSNAVLSCTSSSKSRSWEWCTPFAKCWHVFLYFTNGSESCFRASLSVFEYGTECVTHLEDTHTPDTHRCAESCMIRNDQLCCTTFHRCGLKKTRLNSSALIQTDTCIPSWYPAELTLERSESPPSAHYIAEHGTIFLQVTQSLSPISELIISQKCPPPLSLTLSSCLGHKYLVRLGC